MSAAPPALAVSIRQVSRRFARGAEEVVALRDAELDVPAGQLLAVLGPSGSGKSTLLHILGGIDRPTSGSVRLALGRNGERRLVDLAGLGDEELSRLRRQEVGFVFQSFHLLPTLTAAENVALPLILDGWREPRARQRARELLERVALLPRAGHVPDALSGGERQRVAIARALAADPHLILADEPTGNLDSRQGREILELLRRPVREEGRTVVLVTHDDRVLQFADRVIHLRDGQLLAAQ